jgi:hypothetical protein
MATPTRAESVGAASGGYGLALFGLASLLLTNGCLGPVGLSWVEYPLPAPVFNQLVGLELVTVLLVVPVLVAAGVLARRGHPGAPLVGFGPCGYAAYMFAQYVVGPTRTAYSPAVLLHLAVFASAATLTAWSWSLATAHDWPEPDRARRLRWAALLGAFAAFVLLRYVPLFAGAVTGATIPDEFAATPGFFWSVVLLDLGLVVPATVAAAAAALRGSRLASPATYAAVGWFALVPPSVAAMAVVMAARDDPNASWSTVALLAAFATVTTAVAVRMFGRLLLEPKVPHGGDLGPRASGPAALHRTPGSP